MTTDRQVKYADVPNPWRLEDIDYGRLGAGPLTLGVIETLIGGANRHYAEYEILGDTYAHFFSRLENAYEEQADTLERLLEVYNDDVAKPILGRTETVTYDTEDKQVGQQSTTGTGGRRDLPFGTDGGPYSSKDETTSATNGNTTATKKGTVTTQLSDLGVRPNYETLNGFLDNNRTLKAQFNGIFRDCFTLGLAGWR